MKTSPCDVQQPSAWLTDGPIPAAMNQQLIRDEGHRNAMSLVELTDRMRGSLTHGDEAVHFNNAAAIEF